MRELTMDECELVVGGSGFWGWLKKAVGDIFKAVASTVLSDAAMNELDPDSGPGVAGGFDPGGVTEVISPHPSGTDGTAFRMNDGTFYYDVDGDGTVDARSMDAGGNRYVDFGDGNGWTFSGPAPQ